MAYELTNEKDECFRFDIHSWWRMVALAEGVGWQSKSIISPYDWSGRTEYESSGGSDDLNAWRRRSYFIIVHPFVPAEDAAALADALERALPDLPDDVLAPKDVIFIKETEVTLAMLDEIIAEYKKHKLEIFDALGVPLDVGEVTACSAVDLETRAESPTIVAVPSGCVYVPSLENYWSGKVGKAYLRKFIRFCRGDGFWIG